MNKVILSGNLVKDIELRQSQGGKSVVQNAVAVKRDYKNASGEYDVDFINIVVWGTSAEYLSNYGHKGDRVELVGRWMRRTYQDNNGNNRTVDECVVENISVFPKQQPQQYQQQPRQQAYQQSYQPSYQQPKQQYQQPQQQAQGNPFDYFEVNEGDLPF